MGIIEMITAVAKFFGFVAADVGKAQDASHDANERQAGADAATVAGQNQSLKDIENAKRVEVANQATVANPDAAWTERVHDSFTRPD